MVEFIGVDLCQASIDGEWTLPKYILLCITLRQYKNILKVLLNWKGAIMTTMIQITHYPVKASAFNSENIIWFNSHMLWNLAPDMYCGVQAQHIIWNH